MFLLRDIFTSLKVYTEGNNTHDPALIAMANETSAIDTKWTLTAVFSGIIRVPLSLFWTGKKYDRIFYIYDSKAFIPST